MTGAVIAAILAASVWGSPNQAPETLTQDEVDPGIWQIVQTINKSDWVRTTESCEGHAGGSPAMLGLVSDDIGRVFQLLAQAHEEVNGTPPDAIDPGGLPLRVLFWRDPQVAGGKYQIRMYIMRGDDNIVALKVFKRFSELVTP